MTYENEDHEDFALVALGDQIQSTVDASQVPVVGFIVITADGSVETRSRLDQETFNQAIKELASIL